MRCKVKVFGSPFGVPCSSSQTRRRNRMRHHRFDPRDLFTLQERMNRLFEEAGDRRGGGAREEEGEIERADWIPPADVYEDEREYLLALDLPGINREGLDVSLDESRLVIRGDRAAVEGL